MNAHDVDFGQAVRAAAVGKPAQLDEILRSRRALGDGERALIRSLDDGLLRPNTGGRPRSVSRPAVEKMRHIIEYRRRLAVRGRRTLIAEDMAKEIGVTRAELLRWQTEIQQSENYMKAVGLSYWRLEDWPHLNV